MQEKLELIIHVHKDAAMGYYTVKTLSEKLKDKDNKIKGFLEDIEKKYKEFSDKTKDILVENKISPEEDGFITKMMSSMGISKEVKVDNITIGKPYWQINYDEHEFLPEDFGKSIFLTKEEAEQALAEMKGGSNEV